MEMKNKGAPEQDGKGKRSREKWRVRVTMASKNNCKGERQ
jgi:hypothetical protein